MAALAGARGPAYAETMPLVRLAACTALVLLTAGCGQVSTESSAPGDSGQVEARVMPPPPIEAVDGVAPDIVAEMLRYHEGELSQVRSDCLSSDGEPCDPRPAALRELKEAMRDQSLADGATPQLVARLRLADGGTVLYGEYLSQGGDYCSFSWDETDGGGGGPEECGSDRSACPAACLGASWGADEHRVVLAGTVRADADGLWLEHEDGFSAVYPLTGPTLPSDPSLRVFMAETDHGFYRALKVIRDGQVLASFQLPYPPGASSEGNGWTAYGPITEAADGTVPDVRGVDFQHAVQILKMAGLRPGKLACSSVAGGWAVLEQQPAPGSPLEEGGVAELLLEEVHGSGVAGDWPQCESAGFSP
jgi:PASTA domain-containing protein